MTPCKPPSSDAPLPRFAALLLAFEVLTATAAGPVARGAPQSPAAAGPVVYDVAIRAADKDPDTPPLITRYVVEGAKVRIGGATAKRAYVFNGRVMYVIDNADSSVHVLRHQTTTDYAAHYAEILTRLEASAAAAAPDAKADADRKVAGVKEALERQQASVARDYKLTGVSDTVDGHSCRVWEERENDIKHFEFCVASVASLPGAAQILEGIKTLSEFREGSKFAFGVDFGNAPWWPDIFRFGGLPLRIREYRYELPANEITLTGIRAGVAAIGAFDLPSGYRSEDGPDYTSWYVR